MVAKATRTDRAGNWNRFQLTGLLKEPGGEGRGVSTSDVLKQTEGGRCFEILGLFAM